MSQLSREPAPIRYGVVDMGSNAIRTQVVEIVDGSKGRSLQVLQSRREAVRLGQEVFLTGTIPEPTILAAVDTLRRFRDQCDQLGVAHIRAVATSAIREANNRDQIVERIRQASAIDLEVISGGEEAYLLGIAVASTVDVKLGRSLLVDLGGGSVEVTLVEDGQVISAESYRLGALRVLQALTGSHSESQGDEFLTLLEQYVQSLESRIQDGFGAGKIHRYVATGGNIESLADLMQSEGHGQRVDGIETYPISALSAWTRRLALLSHAERIAQLNLKPDRADTILPAAVVYCRLAQVARVDQVLVPRVGIRDGLLAEVVAGHLSQFHAKDHKETVLAACRALGRKYHFDSEHARRVCEYACSLFDQTVEVHQLGAEARILLEAASLLHDIGVFVSNSRHHRHSYYLIRESELIGLSRDERELVALIARYHRRAHPGRDHAELEGRSRSERLLIAKLAAILRVADALDREHRSKVAKLDVAIAKGVVELRVVPAAPGTNLSLERLAVEQKGLLWHEMFGQTVRLMK